MADNTQQIFDVDAARKAGYSDDEILNHLTSTRAFDVQGAMKAGYSKQDIITHLAGTPAPRAANPQDLATQALAASGLGPAASPGAAPKTTLEEIPWDVAAGNGLKYQAEAQNPNINNNPNYAAESQARLGPPTAGPDTQTPFGGLPEMVGGATRLATAQDRDEKYRAGSQMIAGGMKEAMPFVGEAAITSPGKLIVGYGAGAGSGYVAKKATQAAGGSEAAQQFAEDVGFNTPILGALGIRGGKFNVERPTGPEPSVGEAPGLGEPTLREAADHATLRKAAVEKSRVNAPDAPQAAQQLAAFEDNLKSQGKRVPIIFDRLPNGDLEINGRQISQESFQAHMEEAMNQHINEQVDKILSQPDPQVVARYMSRLRTQNDLLDKYKQVNPGKQADIEARQGEIQDALSKLSGVSFVGLGQTTSNQDKGDVLSPNNKLAKQDTVAAGYQVEALGGKVKGTVVKTSQGTTVAGKIGPYTVSKTFVKAEPTEPTATPIGNIQHPEATAPEENIGEFSPKTIANFQKQQARAMQEGDTAAADALAGMLDADAAKKASSKLGVQPAAGLNTPPAAGASQEKLSIVPPTEEPEGNAHFIALRNETGETRGGILLRKGEGDEEGTFQVGSAGVRPDLKGQGYGTKLYQAAIDYAKQQGANKIVSDVSPSPDAIKVWQKLGGVKVGQFGNQYSISLKGPQLESTPQQPQAEQGAKVETPRDIEGETPTQGPAKPINEQAPAYSAEQIEHRNNFLKYQGEYNRIQTALDKAEAAKRGGFTRGAMNEAGVNWHQKELARLENKMGESLRSYARVSPPEHIDQMRAGLVQGLQNTKGTADRLSKLIQTDKAAKTLRKMLPELPAAQKKEGRALLGDQQDPTKLALKQAKFFSPKLKPKVDEAHKEIGDTLSGLIQQYGEGNPVATKYAVALKEGLKGEALTEAHVKAILGIVPVQAKGEISKFLDILKNELPVVLHHPSIKGTASSALPEINLRNLRQMLGKPNLQSKNPQATMEQRTDLKVLQATDPQAARKEREELARGLVSNLEAQARKKASFLQKQLGVIDKASGAGKRANEKLLADLINKHRSLKEVQTHELEALVADTKTLHKVFPQMNVMQQAKAKLQGELTKRADADRQQKEILKFKVGHVLEPTPKPQVVAPVSSQLPQARYFADEWYQTPELSAAASLMDSKIAKMSPSVIKKYLGPLAKKVAKGDKQSIALLNAYNKRLAEFGQAEIPAESLLEKQAKNITNPQQAPIGPQVGEMASFRLPIGNVISGRVESIADGMVKIVRANGSKNIQPIERFVSQAEPSKPSVVESKPEVEQKKEEIKPPDVVEASRQEAVSSFKKGDLYQKMEVMANFYLAALTRGTNPELRKLVPELQAKLGSPIEVVQALAKKGLKKAQDISELYEATISQSMNATVQDVASSNLEKVISPAPPAPPTGASGVGVSIPAPDPDDIGKPFSPAAEKLVSQAQDVLREQTMAKLQKLSDSGLTELVPKILEWVKERTDLGRVRRQELAGDMADAAMSVPKEKAFSAAYKLAREGAPPLSTWTAETGGEKRKQAVQSMRPDPVEASRQEAVASFKKGDLYQKMEVMANFYLDALTRGTNPEMRKLVPELRSSLGSPIEVVQALAKKGLKKAQDISELYDAAISKSMEATVQDVAGTNLEKVIKPSTPELEAAKQRATQTMQAIEKMAGELGINRLRAIAKGLDISLTGKIYALDKALTLYHDGLKVGDPNALARARDFLLAQNGEPNTGRMSLFGLDRVVNFLTNSQKQQIPVPSARLENIRKAQAAEKQGPSITEKLRTLPYTVLTKMYDQFQYLDQNPTRFEKWFAPELIKDFEARTGIKEIRIDSNPWKQARLAYGGGGGVVHAAAIELSRVSQEAADKGLLDNLKAYLNLVAYDRAIRNVRGKATTAIAEARRLRANADQLETHIKLGAEPQHRYAEVVSLRKQAKEQKETAKEFGKKLARREVVPEGYTQASIAQDLRLLQQDLGPRDYSFVEGLANRVYAELKKSWDDLHQTGMISDAVHQRGELLGRGYIPLARILEVTQDVNRTFGTSSMNVRTRKSLQELEGSKLYNIDPIDAALNQIQLAARETQKNAVARAVLNLAHMDPNGYGQAIKVPSAGYKLAPNEGTMVHWENGQKNTYVVPRFLASVIENATPAGSAVVGAGLLRATAGTFRLGATLANLRFSIPNAIRDLQDYASLSKTGMIIKGVLHPFEFGKIVHDWIGTLKSTIAEDSEYLQMMRARAGFSTIQRNLSASPEMLRSNALKGGGLNPFAKVIHTIEQFNDIVENNTKLTAFKRNRELITGGKQGPLTKEQLDWIAWETRNYGGSPDFASKGTMSAAINLLWMFFNAKVQGTGRTVKRMTDPKRAFMLLGTYTMMGLALMGHNMQFMAPENDGTFEYQHISATDKQNYYIIITPGTYQTSTGGIRHNYFKVSKGHLGQLISNPIEDAIQDYTIGHVNLGQTALDFVGNMLPGQFNFRQGHVTEGSVSGAISSWNPLIKEPIDQARNMDSFKSIPIEPKGMENLENPERYDPNTSLTARRVARVIYDNTGKDQGLAKAPIIGPMLTSPMRLQHAVSGFGAGVADDALRMADWAQGQNKDPKVPLEGTEALAHTPVVGGVISRFVGSPLDQIEKDLETEFYQAAETATIQKGTFDHMAKVDPKAAKQYLEQNKTQIAMSEAVLDIQKTLGELRNAQKQVLASQKLEPDQIRSKIQKLHEARMKLLKMFHEKLAPKLVTN